jgi:hypothetical protein
MSQNVTLPAIISVAQEVIGPFLGGAEMSEDRGVADGELSRRAGIDVACPHAVYISAQMLEKHSQNCHSCHFWGRSACPLGGTARSARYCSIIRSDMIPARRDWPGHSKASGYRCIETAISIPLIVHYLRWLRMAPDPHSLAIRDRTWFQRSLLAINDLEFEVCPVPIGRSRFKKPRPTARPLITMKSQPIPHSSLTLAGGFP